RHKQLDLLLDFESSYRNTYLALLSGARFRAGYALTGRRAYLNPLYQLRVRREELPLYRRDQHRGLLERLGIPAPFTRPEFHPAPGGARAVDRFFRGGRKNGGWVGVNPGGAGDAAR